MSDKPSSKKTTCPDCGAEEDWGGASWCPACGFYPAIRRQVAVLESAEEETVYENWWEAVPNWVRVMGAIIGGLFVLSVGVRVVFADSVIRTWWTAAQMAIGIVMICVLHLMAYFYAVGRTDKLGPLDMIMQPLKTWQPALQDLPRTSNLVSSMGCGFAAIVLAFFVVDGIDYVAIMQEDANARKQEMAEQAARDAAEGKKKTSPMGYVLKSAAAIAQAKQAMSPPGASLPPQSLEDAIGEFAGAAGVNEDGGLGAGGAGGVTFDSAAGPTEIGSVGDSVAAFSGAGEGHFDSYLQHQHDVANGAVIGGGRMNSPATGAFAMNTTGQSSTRAPSLSKERNARPPAESANLQTPGNRATGDSVDSGDKQHDLRPEDAAAGTMKDVVECLVLGYTTNTTGEIRSLLLAAAPDRKLLRFVAKVPVEQIDESVLATMKVLFSEIPARNSLVRCPFGGRWIQPEVFCLVTFSGWTAEDRLNAPAVIALVPADTQ